MPKKSRNKKIKVQASATMTMSVYDAYKEYKPNPEWASLKDHLTLLPKLLTQMQAEGVKSGTKLRVTVETIE